MSSWCDDVSQILTISRAQDQKKLCRLRRTLLVSNKALSFPTKLCRFWENLNKNASRFFQHGTVVNILLLRRFYSAKDKLADKALSENRELRNWIKHVEACRTCVPASRCDTTKTTVYKLTNRGNLPYHQQTVMRRTFVLSWRFRNFGSFT